ncbi:MAG: hypothetical protein R3240_02240 [Gammaproteobacteria bacterium]|nr:hypothetical protein [Gammaproteobacteria bacterium]
MLNTVVLIFISFFLLSCSDNSTGLSSNKSQNQKLPSYLVKETFNVGNNVFVRSLSLDEKNNLLWVGTSTGVVKVDLESGNVLETITRENGLANE